MELGCYLIPGIIVNSKLIKVLSVKPQTTKYSEHMQNILDIWLPWYVQEFEFNGEGNKIKNKQIGLYQIKSCTAKGIIKKEGILLNGTKYSYMQQ